MGQWSACAMGSAQSFQCASSASTRLRRLVWLVFSLGGGRVLFFPLVSAHFKDIFTIFHHSYSIKALSWKDNDGLLYGVVHIVWLPLKKIWLLLPTANHKMHTGEVTDRAFSTHRVATGRSAVFSPVAFKYNALIFLWLLLVPRVGWTTNEVMT